MTVANPERAEVEVKALGETFVFVLDFLALARLDHENPGMLDDGLDVTAPWVLLKAFQYGLARHHPTVTEEIAAAMIQELGTPKAASIIIKSASAGYAKDMLPANPRKAARTSNGAGKNN